jgi:hypothetical protein
MTLDVDKLRGDISKAQAARSERVAAKGHSKRVLMAGIREALPTIEASRALPEEQRPTWEDIATALSKQGLKTRKGEPLTAMRLTSLVNAIRSQDAARAKKERSRKRRADLASSDAQGRIAGPSPRRSKVATQVQLGSAQADVDSLEAEIRQSRFKKHDELFKE